MLWSARNNYGCGTIVNKTYCYILFYFVEHWVTMLVAFRVRPSLPQLTRLREMAALPSPTTPPWKCTFWLARWIPPPSVFQPMSNEHVSTWTASNYTVQITMFHRGSACVYVVYVVKTSIRNYFLKLDIVVGNSVFTVCNVKSCSAYPYKKNTIQIPLNGTR